MFRVALSVSELCLPLHKKLLQIYLFFKVPKYRGQQVNLAPTAASPTLERKGKIRGMNTKVFHRVLLCHGAGWEVWGGGGVVEKKSCEYIKHSSFSVAFLVADSEAVPTSGA